MNGMWEKKKIKKKEKIYNRRKTGGKGIFRKNFDTIIIVIIIVKKKKEKKTKYRMKRGEKRETGRRRRRRRRTCTWHSLIPSSTYSVGVMRGGGVCTTKGRGRWPRVRKTPSAQTLDPTRAAPDAPLQHFDWKTATFYPKMREKNQFNSTRKLEKTFFFSPPPNYFSPISPLFRSKNL